MTINAHLHRKNRWVLGRNRREVDATEQFGTNGARRFDFDGFWSGNKWVKGKVNAVNFDSEAAAVEYLDGNLARMEAPPTPFVRI